MFNSLRKSIQDAKNKLGDARIPVTDRAMRQPVPPPSLERLALVGYLRGKAQEKKGEIPDMQKPQFTINSLDKQNNDPMKGNLLDTFRGATDVKPLPGATFMGSTSNIPVLRN
jgi:hypothetical protein